MININLEELKELDPPKIVGSQSYHSYHFIMEDIINPPKIEKPKLRPYEIWVGLIPSWGQGDHPTTEPKRLGVVNATSFKIACCIFEHQSSIDDLKARMERGDTHIEDAWFGTWAYNPKDNSNIHIGKYYETREEALKTFQKSKKQ